MSTRIHELAKLYNMEGKELLTLLKERGYVSADTKSVSSTVSKIYLDEIEKELGARRTPEAAAPEAPPKHEHHKAPTPVTEPPDETAPAKVKLPAGVFVKSADDVVRQREAAKAAAAAAHAVPAAPPAPPRPGAGVVPPRPASPPPLPPQPAAPRPVVTLAPAVVKREEPHPAPAPVQPSQPKPVPATPEASRPASPPPLSPRSPARPPAVRIPGEAPAPTPSSATVTIEGDVKVIHLKPPVIVRDFATALGLRPFQLISELMQMGVFASISQSLDEAVASKIAEKHGFLLEVRHRGDPAAQQAQKEKVVKKPEEDESKHLVTRPPIVCILGHVDHGKTSLLDTIRKANVAGGEAGGITQHIGAYQIEFNGRKITFLDTPGHAAFNRMRARGASATDIAVLVVAADDGFMPQTEEALQHIQSAKVALIVAVNKMDVKGANLDQVKAQMQQRSIAPEDWGGETITVPVSATKGTGINELLEMILLQADVLELKANPKAEASGVIIESQMEVGRGPLATVIVQRGTLKVGDALVCGPHWAKVRAIYDDKGAPLKEASPATPARVIGWSGTPDSGATFRAVKNAREAEKLAEEEAQQLKKAAVAAAPAQDVSVEKLFANIAATQQRTLKLVIKTDVFGTAEAVRTILEGIKTTKVTLEIVSTDVGLVTKNDVLMAAASGSVIVGFSTKLENGVTPLAKHHGVKIELFEIIYELGDRVREMMADLLEPDLKEVKLGAAEVRAVFPLAKGFVAGCLVTEGKINRNATSRLRRGKETIHEGKVATLKRFKDDANEVRAGLECGIKLDDFNGYEVGDIIECFEIQKVRASL
jgi:translation initiation factor IF-2